MVYHMFGFRDITPLLVAHHNPQFVCGCDTARMPRAIMPEGLATGSNLMRIRLGWGSLLLIL